ncbi:MAG: beta strand repeat-containing protein, partial [Planctomycetota bacterium]
MKHVLSLTLMVSFALLALVSIVTAGAPGMMNYQGRLTDAGGDPLDDTLSITFTIYDDPTGGSNLWSETHADVVVTEGLFNVILGETNPVDDSVFADTARWLQITVEGEDIDPRTRLVTAAYAFRVETVDGATGGIISGDVDIQSDLTVSGKATIGPGHTNTGSYSFVAGESNTTTGNRATVGGGEGNTAGSLDVVAGGYGNTESGGVSVVGGGQWNTAAGNAGTVGGGAYDTASGQFATVPGGVLNTAGGDYSFAAGLRAKVDTAHHGTFIWADHTNADFASTGQDQFLIRAAGGVGIGTNSPGEALEVAGIIYSNTGGIKFPDATIQTTAATGGGGGGWTDDGDVVRLETSEDSVGIGTATPTEKLEVDGNIKASGTITSGSSITIDGSADKITATSGTIDFDDENILTTGKATIGPGHANTGSNSFVAGESNTASGDRATVGGGRWNVASAAYATVGGGTRDTASGVFATVPGGAENTAGGDFSFAAGFRAKVDAAHHGTFIWADFTDADFASTGQDQFLIRATGGVGIGTNSPGEALEVAGIIYSNTGGIKFPDATVQTTAASGGWNWQDSSSYGPDSVLYAGYGDSTDAITDGGIDLADIGQNGASADQIMKWNGSAWALSSDETGNEWNWQDSSSYGPDSVLYAGYADSTDAITDGGIDLADIGQNGASADQIMKWNGSAWALSSDETGSGNGWADDGTIVRLETSGDSVGIGTATPSEKLDVDGNIKASGTITSGSSIIIDGSADKITATSGTIDFDNENIVTTGKATIGPGHTNTGTNAFVAGDSNTVTANRATVGGYLNTATGGRSTVGGGCLNTAGGLWYATVGGGYTNTASGQWCATIAGGRENQA